MAAHVELIGGEHLVVNESAEEVRRKLGEERQVIDLTTGKKRHKVHLRIEAVAYVRDEPTD
jgi:uncharacterized protein YlzI (FlbEa/FlbD family)